MSVSDKDASDQQVRAQTDELRVKYPIFTAVLERIPVMDLQEVVSVLLLVDPVRSVLRTRATRLSFIGEDKALDRMVEEKINELKTKYSTLAGVLERIHKMGSKRDRWRVVRN
jgi:hypothetical protein